MRPDDSTAASRLAGTPPTNSAPPFDYERSISRLGGDAVLFREIVALFMEDSRQLMDRAHQGLAGEDCALLERAAHSLKGLAANFDAGEVVWAAQSVEQFAHERDLAGAASSIERLAGAVIHLRDALATFLDRRRGK
jgi:HPt (histidine-containing phosphotransfer) domain-containing protein